MNNKQNYTSIRHHTRPPPKQNTSHQTTAVTGKYSLKLSPPSLETSHFPFSPGWLVSHHTTPRQRHSFRPVPSLVTRYYIPLRCTFWRASFFPSCVHFASYLLPLFLAFTLVARGRSHNLFPILSFCCFLSCWRFLVFFFVCVVVVVCGTGGVRLAVSSRYTPPWCLPRRVGME